MIPPEAIARLRQVASLNAEDVYAWTAIGSTSAAAILADLDTLCAVRAYVNEPHASMPVLRALLGSPGAETNAVMVSRANAR